MQSLGHACIFCTSNPRGQRTFFLLRTCCQAIRYPWETSSSVFSVTDQNPCHIYHSPPSIAAIPVWYQALCYCYLHKLGTTIFCDLLTCAPTSTSHLQLLLYVHQQ